MYTKKCITNFVKDKKQYNGTRNAGDDEVIYRIGVSSRKTIAPTNLSAKRAEMETMQ